MTVVVRTLHSYAGHQQHQHSEADRLHLLTNLVHVNTIGGSSSVSCLAAAVARTWSVIAASARGRSTAAYAARRKFENPNHQQPYSAAQTTARHAADVTHRCLSHTH